MAKLLHVFLRQLQGDVDYAVEGQLSEGPWHVRYMAKSHHCHGEKPR